jgi:hypothetical protein
MIDDEFEVRFENFYCSRACKTPPAKKGDGGGLPASPTCRGRKKTITPEFIRFVSELTIDYSTHLRRNKQI